MTIKESIYDTFQSDWNDFHDIFHSIIDKGPITVGGPAR